MRWLRFLGSGVCLAAVSLVGAACGPRDEPPADRRESPAARSATDTAALSSDAPAVPRIVILGDSLTAGLGLGGDEAFPALLQRRVDDRRLTYHVINAGVSGDTSAGGLSRLDWALEGNVKFLVLALGANDGLRGVPVDELRRNLDEIIRRAHARGITVVLVGMEAPPNFGRSYTSAFHNVYPELARQHHLALVPFLLHGVAAIDALNQRDGLHPNARGAQIVADNVWSVLKATLEGKAPRD